MNLELILWRDASEEISGWQSPEDIGDEHYVVHSVGYVCKETENAVTLCMDLGADGQTNGRGRIPKPMIISRTVLSIPEEAK